MTLVARRWRFSDLFQTSASCSPCAVGVRSDRLCVPLVRKRNLSFRLFLSSLTVVRIPWTVRRDGVICLRNKFHPHPPYWPFHHVFLLISVWQGLSSTRSARHNRPEFLAQMLSSCSATSLLGVTSMQSCAVPSQSLAV